MTTTVKVKIRANGNDKNLGKITTFLSAQGMTYIQKLRNLDDVTLYVELKDYPEILGKLERSGSELWYLSCCSDQGITLHIPTPKGDCSVFLPRQNIVALHDIDMNVYRR